MSINFETIESLRVTKVDKERMIKKIYGLKREETHRAKINPMIFFKGLREKMKTNKIICNNKKKQVPLEKIQTMLNKKILVFDKEYFEMKPKDTH